MQFPDSVWKVYMWGLMAMSRGLKRMKDQEKIEKNSYETFNQFVILKGESVYKMVENH